MSGRPRGPSQLGTQTLWSEQLRTWALQGGTWHSWRELAWVGEDALFVTPAGVPSGLQGWRDRAQSGRRRGGIPSLPESLLWSLGANQGQEIVVLTV